LAAVGAVGPVGPGELLAVGVSDAGALSVADVTSVGGSDVRVAFGLVVGVGHAGGLGATEDVGVAGLVARVDGGCGGRLGLVLVRRGGSPRGGPGSTGRILGSVRGGATVGVVGAVTPPRWAYVDSRLSTASR
jgi:hypothetical protein